MPSASRHVRFQIGPAVFDPADGSWIAGGQVVILPPRLTQILALLAEHAPGVVGKRDLIERVWGERLVSEAALTQRIKELRRLLGEDARHPRIVSTVARRGYRLSVPVAPLADESPTPRGLLARALAFADRFEWGKAHDLLHAAVGAEPRLAVAWAWLAHAHLWREDAEGAGEAAARGAALADGLGEAERHFVLATHASFCGKLADMVDHLELLLDVEPAHFWGAYRLAHAYLLAGRVDDSLRMRELCRRLRPEHPTNIAEAAFTRLFAAGDLEGAARDCERVRELDPNHPFALPFLLPSFRAWLAGDLEAAREAIDQVLDRRLESFLPLGRVSALVHDARFRLFLGDVPTALADLDRALAGLRPGSTVEGWARLELAATLRELGDGERAERELAGVSSSGTPLNRAHALLWRGVLAARAGSTAAAAAAIDVLRAIPDERPREFGYPTARVIERVRRVFPVLIQGEIALSSGDPAGAIAAFTEAATVLPLYLDAPVPLSTTDPRCHLLAREGIARAHAAAGRPAAALAAEDWLLSQRLPLFVTARAGVGVYVAALARRAVLKQRLGRRPQARSDAGEVLARWGRVSPSPPPVHAAEVVLHELESRSIGLPGAAPEGRSR